MKKPRLHVAAGPRESTVEDAYLHLLGAILSVGARDPDYFREPCGRFWASVGGVEPAILFREAVSGTKREGERWTPISRHGLHGDYAPLS